VLVLIDHCSALDWGYRLAVSNVPVRLNVDTDWLYHHMTCVGLMCFRSGEKEHLVTLPHGLCERVASEDSIYEKPLTRRHVFNMPFDVKMSKSDGVRIHQY